MKLDFKFFALYVWYVLLMDKCWIKCIDKEVDYVEK